jgi:RND family efflux transporter MFP subunit
LPFAEDALDISSSVNIFQNRTKNKYTLMKRIVFAIELLTVMLVVSSCGGKKEEQAKAPVRVKTEVAAACASATGQSYVGIVEEREATAVSFTGMGVVRRVLVSEGQAVSKGQLLAEMDDTQARNLLSGAEAAMMQANDALHRYGQLHDAGSLSEAQWVEIQSKVAQAQSQLEVARKNLSDCQLLSPVSGIVGRKHVKAGETALPSQAVVTLFDISSLKVKVSVPEAEIGDIGAHTPSYIYVEAVDKHLEGGIIEKGVQADALTHTYDLRINVANAGRRLLPGMVASVQFGATSDGQSSLPLLPVTAVQRRADGSLFVWTVDKDNSAHRVAVTIVQTRGNRIEIASGLSLGERVVTEGYQKLSEGTKVVF